ncbi:hypothetical protein [Mesorhizobium sp.]|uniref:hypothetical protein n=1 Tax=Mesorhizobium sp. TaxID=1871066 RepID=UPI000FE87393|nr:hypothetical protein [Mesorhizobium sp.]RWP37430.1 MAG: hypothetical protein EOR03_04995 [Mesorhizobium sp.]
MPQLSSSLQEINVKLNFLDPPESSVELLKRAEALGLKPNITATELDAVRARGPQIRELLANDPVRREKFASDPSEALAGLVEIQIRPSDPSPKFRTQWEEFPEETETGLRPSVVVRKWVRAKNGRLKVLRENPADVVKLILSASPTETGQQIVESIQVSSPPDRN